MNDRPEYAAGGPIRSVTGCTCSRYSGHHAPWCPAYEPPKSTTTKKALGQPINQSNTIVPLHGIQPITKPHIRFPADVTRALEQIANAIDRLNRGATWSRWRKATKPDRADEPKLRVAFYAGWDARRAHAKNKTKESDA